MEILPMGKIFIWFGDEARICMRLYSNDRENQRTRHFITLKFKLQVLILLLNQINQLLKKCYRVKLSMHFLTMFIYVLCCDFQFAWFCAHLNICPFYRWVDHLHFWQWNAPPVSELGHVHWSWGGWLATTWEGNVNIIVRQSLPLLSWSSPFLKMDCSTCVWTWTCPLIQGRLASHFINENTNTLVQYIEHSLC